MAEEIDGKTLGSTVDNTESARTFTQTELDALIGSARTKGRESGLNAALQELGVGSIADANSLLEKARQLKEAQMSELEKAHATIAEYEGKLNEQVTISGNYEAMLKEYKQRNALQNEALKDDYRLRREALGDLLKVAKIDGLLEKIEFDENDNPKNAAEVLKKLIAERDYLIQDEKPKTTIGTPSIRSVPKQSNEGKPQIRVAY